MWRARREADNLEIEGLQRFKLAEFQPQQVLVPARLLRQPVVRDRIGPQVSFGEVRQHQGRDQRQPELLGGLHTAMSRNEPAPVIDQNRLGEAELADRGRELRDLLLGVSARIALRGLEIARRPHLHHRRRNDSQGSCRIDVIVFH